MSWWISLCDENGYVTVPNHNEGGTVNLNGGEDDAAMSVTSNYSQLISESTKLSDLRGFHGMSGKKAAPILATAVAYLSIINHGKVSTDYWEATPGNVAKCLKILLDWALQHPVAEFNVN